MKPLVLRPRELRLALMASALILCWAFVAIHLQPLWDRVQELHRHIETQQEKLTALGRLLAQAPTVEHHHEGVTIYLEAEDDEQARQSFLNELEALSRGASLQLNLKPRAVKRDGRLSRFDIELDAEGSQQNLMSFLDALVSLPRLITIERLRISGVPTKRDLLRANLVIQKLTLHP